VISPADRAAAECRSGSHAGSRRGLGGRFRWPDCSFPDGEAPAAARSGDVRSRRPDTVLPTAVRPVPPLADGLRSRVLGVSRGVTGCGSRGGAIAAHADGVFDAPESPQAWRFPQDTSTGACRCKRRSGPRLANQDASATLSRTVTAMTGPTPKMPVRVVRLARTTTASLSLDSPIWASRRRTSSGTRRRAPRRACPAPPPSLTCFSSWFLCS